MKPQALPCGFIASAAMQSVKNVAQKRQMTQYGGNYGQKDPNRGVIREAGHMSNRRLLGVALLGLTLATTSIVTPAQAERLTIVNRNSDSQLKVSINRAVVV
ncbi:MAG: hypothetical protein VYA97_00480, partial [Pseudomonadota bacterium]|nr:hypothetical protein [Pseudomonadota bacterium]